jgi:molecular chaperone GrpE
MPNSHENDEHQGQGPPAQMTTSEEAAPADQVAEQAAELARLEDRYKRALADLDNYRKRSAREVEQRVAADREALLREWLEVVDNVERALRMDPHSPLSEGLRAVHDQMETILARHGVERTGAAGERFDPELHEAVAVRVNGDVPDRTILEVPRAGFTLGDHVLRPAQVVVSRRPEHDA